jgi:hypothetical protein
MGRVLWLTMLYKGICSARKLNAKRVSEKALKMKHREKMG